MASALIVTAPAVVVRDVVGSQHYFYAGAVLPAGLDGDHVKQLVDQKMVAEVSVADPAEVEAADPVEVTEPKSERIDDILASVGDDRDKAAEALATEQAKGDKARPRLVEKLQALTTPAG